MNSFSVLVRDEEGGKASYRKLGGLAMMELVIPKGPVLPVLL